MRRKGGTNMKEVIFNAHDGKKLYCSLWDNVARPIGIVQIIHGMDEHVRRYDRFARFLNKNGYIVFGDDHRAHGRTAGSTENIGKPNGEPDLFDATAHDEIAIAKYLKKKYKLPLFIFGHSYGSFITQRIMQEPDLYAAGVCMSGSAKYPRAFLILACAVAWLGMKLRGPSAPAKFIEYFSPIRNKATGPSKLTRDPVAAAEHNSDPMHVKYFSYGFYYSMFKNLGELNGTARPDVPLLIISGSCDMVSLNSRFAKTLYRMYKSGGLENLRMIIYPGARHELLMETNYKDVQNDVLEFFNSIAHKHHKK